MENDDPRYGVWRGLFNTLCVFAAILAFARSCGSPSQNPAAGTTTNYQQRFCENEVLHDFTKKNPPQITITMNEGCFGDHVQTPLAWNTAFVQKSQAVGDWAAMWCNGQPVPSPPSPYYDNMGNAFQTCPHDFGHYDFYLEGKGTFTIRRTSVRPEYAAQAQDNSQPEKVTYRLTPTLPAKGQPEGYNVVLQQCYREGERVKCWGKITNTTDASAHLLLYGRHGADDEGNGFDTVAQYDDAPATFMSDHDEKLLPNVPLKFFITVNDAHMNAKKLAINLRTFWEGDRQGRYDDFVFDDMPIQ